MEPVSLIVAALAAGAVAGAQSTATEAVRDAYHGLKAAIQRLFRGRPAGQTALEQHEQKPEAWEGALEAELVDAGAGQDIGLVNAAQQLLALVDEAGTRAGKYQVDLRGAQGVQVGDGNTMTNTFTTPPAG